MSPTATLAAYALALAVVFGTGLAVGSAVGPVGTAGGEHSGDTSHSEMEMSR